MEKAFESKGVHYINMNLVGKMTNLHKFAGFVHSSNTV